MKFKTLRTITEQVSGLVENSSSNVSSPEWNSGTPIGDVDTAHMYPEQEGNLDKLNFWLKTMQPTNKPVFDIHSHLQNIRMKMNLAGFDIPVNRQTEISDNMEFKVSQFGGREGMNEQGQYFKDCGISYKNNGKGLKLVVTANKVDGAYVVDTKIEEDTTL